MEGVLRRTIQVEDLLLNGSYTIKDGGWKLLILRDHSLKILNCSYFGQQILLSVCRPQNYDSVTLRFHRSNILPNLINNFLIISLKNVVSAVSLI